MGVKNIVKVLLLPKCTRELMSQAHTWTPGKETLIKGGARAATIVAIMGAAQIPVVAEFLVSSWIPIAPEVIGFGEERGLLWVATKIASFVGNHVIDPWFDRKHAGRQTIDVRAEGSTDWNFDPDTGRPIVRPCIQPPPLPPGPK